MKKLLIVGMVLSLSLWSGWSKGASELVNTGNWYLQGTDASGSLAWFGPDWYDTATFSVFSGPKPVWLEDTVYASITAVPPVDPAGLVAAGYYPTGGGNYQAPEVPEASPFLLTTAGSMLILLRRPSKRGSSPGWRSVLRLR